MGNVTANAGALCCPRLQDSASGFARVQDSRRWIRYEDDGTRGQPLRYYAAGTACYTELSNNRWAAWS